MDLKLSGLTVLVTGGSAGIGAAIVQELLNEGCNVAFCSRSQEKINSFLSTAKNPHNKRLISKSLDVRNIEEFPDWLQELKHIDIFIHNASALSFENIFLPNENKLSTDFNDLIETDLIPTIKLIDLVLPYLEKSTYGAITYIGSIASSTPTKSMPAYGAIKIALTHYMKTLSKKLMLKNIRVNTVSPGDIYVPNGFWDQVKNQRFQVYEKVLERNPMGRLGNPIEIAKVVAFISSPLASFVSGVNWLVDGNSTNQIQN